MSPDRPLMKLTRRQLLQAAGGVTFLALTPTQDGAFAAAFDRAHSADRGPALPIFNALPYLQAGPAGSKLADGQESIVLCWQTNGLLADYVLEYGPQGSLGSKAEIVRKERLSAQRVDNERCFNHTATLTGMSLDRRYAYRLRMNGEVLMEGYFTTRKPRGVKSRFAAFGDNSYGSASDRAIAFQTYKTRPDFVMNTGDNVYENGLDGEYARYFFPVYNSEQAGPRTGAPLLRSVPYYSVIANHDVHGKDAKKNPVADFTKDVDALAYFTNFHFPLNGPAPTHPTPMIGDAEALANFHDCAGSRFPNMANYSYDYADAHFLCLDSNLYVDPTDAALQSWIEADLAGADAAWKFVVYHHPAFNAGLDHYSEQHMRVLSPLFEKHGVDLVLHGHEHNYQRTRPIRFEPGDVAGAKHINTKNRLTPGKFTIDVKFDGKSVTKPDGILYITTGAGGNSLYDPQSNDKPELWRHKEDDNVEYVVRFVSDRHSLTVFDMDRQTLALTQIDEWGNVIDRCRITKS